MESADSGDVAFSDEVCINRSQVMRETLTCAAEARATRLDRPQRGTCRAASVPGTAW